MSGLLFRLARSDDRAEIDSSYINAPEYQMCAAGIDVLGLLANALHADPTDLGCQPLCRLNNYIVLTVRFQPTLGEPPAIYTAISQGYPVVLIYYQRLAGGLLLRFSAAS